MDGKTERRNINVDAETQIAELSFIKKSIGSIGGIILIQLLGAIWWASAMTANMEYVKADIISIKATIALSTADRYTGNDAKRDLAVIDKRMSDYDQKIKDLETTIIDIKTYGSPITIKRLNALEEFMQRYKK